MKNINMIIYLLPPTVITFFLLFSVTFFLKLWRKKEQWGKRSPLRDYKLWRSPGESLREQIEDANTGIVADLANIPMIFLVFAPLYFSQLLIWQKGGGTHLNFWIAITVNLLFIAFCVWRIIKTWSRKHDLQSGLDGEIYVGQQLDHLMLLGCRVYHDFQTEKLSNIAHIVVSPAGVYAVETKGRYKPDIKRGRQNYTVVFDGQHLHFSDVLHTDQPICQAQRNAVIFSKWLSGTVGENIKVTPVVALPGWCVELRGIPKNGKIYNGKLEDDKGRFDISKMKRSFFLSGNRRQPPLSSFLFNRIVHQLDQKCRKVSPLAYRSR